MNTPPPDHSPPSAAGNPKSGSPATPAPSAAAAPPSVPPAAPAGAAEAHSPVRRASRAATKPPVGADDRRDFFSEAMRETLAPFAGMLERKIQPFLAALEAIPYEAERIAGAALPGAMDQPQSRTHSLPVEAPDPTPAPFLRPPGAMAPGEFETVCSRCGKCAEACPARAILLDEALVVADGYPYILIQVPGIALSDPNPGMLVRLVPVSK